MINYSSPSPELVGRSKHWKFAVDPYLLIFMLIFITLSSLLLYSTDDDGGLLSRQLINYLIAFIIFIIVSQIPSTMLKFTTPYLFTIGILLLILVLFIGTKGKGAQRWINLGSFNIQPSEFFKVLLPMMLAWWFNYADENALVKVTTWLVVIVITSLSVLLIAIQPDLGSSLMILLAGLIVIFLAGLSWKITLFFFFSFSASLPFLWLSMHSYQKQRVLTFLDPYKDPLGSGYHIIQSLIAIGSGGLYGRGWQGGSQSRLDFVPEQHTDFIFTILAEEFGLLGSVLLICLYFLLSLRCMYIAHQAQNHFLRLLGATMSIMILIYSFVNIAMVLGLVPVVGLPLPFLSYGGSALITYAIILGILSSIRFQKQ